MAISEETAALVAAQLTVAWATRAGVRTAPSKISREEGILRRYHDFRRSVLADDTSDAIGLERP